MHTLIARMASLVLSFCICTATAQAQTSIRPDAGTLLQQIEQGREPVLPTPQRPVLPPKPEMKPRGDLVVPVTRFQFVGNTLLADAALQAAVAPWVNRVLDFSELQKAAAAVAAAYRDAGWVVRTYLPQQEISDGVVTIQIIEAVLGSVSIEGAQNTRVREEQIRGLVAAAQRPGQPINSDAIDRALLLMEDLAGVSVKGNLVQGRDEGQTDLGLSLAGKKFVSGEVAADNTGSRATGRNRFTAAVSVASPLRRGDQFSADVIHTRGSDYLRAGWVFPVGGQGWRLGASHSRLQYRVVAPEFAALGLRGRSETYGVEGSYPLIRSRMKNLYFSAKLDRKDYFNETTNAVTSDYGIRVAGFNLFGNLYDSVLGGGYTTGSVGWDAGTLDLTGSPNEAADAAGPRAAGHYRKIRFALSRFQVLTSELSLFGSLTGQRADKNLDSGEKFYLGGVGGVRAYPSSEAGGAEGLLVNLEARYRLPGNAIFTGFYDWGRVTVNKDNDFPGAAAVNSITLKGTGVSVGWTTPQGASLKAIVARRIGNNPNPTATGTDQDGSLDLNRLWWQASLPF